MADNETVLNFQNSFIETLKCEAEQVLGTKLEIGIRFKSADSFSYLLRSENQQFVGKIYRFEHWPPEGKLQLIQKLLDSSGVLHEEIVYSASKHPVFKFGWQVNRFIPGGSVREARQTGNITDEDYYFKLGKILRMVHTIKMDYFGFVSNTGPKFKSFKEFTFQELHDHDYHDLPAQFAYAADTIGRAKEEIFNSLDSLDQCNPVLVHDDANEGNVMWNYGNPILIDWTDSLAAPPERDFACLTFRQDKPILELIELGYGVPVDKRALRFHQIMRFIRLGQFYYLEDGDLEELKKMMERLESLLSKREPYGV